MKRSKMLKIIEKLFDIPRFPKDKKLTADLVLTELERVGMLPPKVKVEHKQRLQDPATKEYGDFVSWTYKSVWEDESKQSDKIMPSALTEEEVKELIENDEDLKRE